jgi:hypothetical protein
VYCVDSSVINEIAVDVQTHSYHNDNELNGLAVVVVVVVVVGIEMVVNIFHIAVKICRCQSDYLVEVHRVSNARSNRILDVSTASSPIVVVDSYDVDTTVDHIDDS